jgi:hypothetical protein
MEKIVEHIERLLLWHDCVIIPDFGGFVLQSVPAVYTGDEHLFVPARKEIVFNPTLTHNDGLLTESYMQEYAVAFNEAQKYVRADVFEMKENLDDDLHIQFGRIGLFIKEDDRIIFIPAGNSNELFCTSSYGLPVFHYLSLAARQPAIHNIGNAVASTAVVSEEKQPKTNNPANRIKSGNIIYTIPVTRTFARIFVAAVAAVVLFFLISTPVMDVNKASYSASFVPQEIMPVKSADEIVSNAFSVSEVMPPIDIPAINTAKEVVDEAKSESAAIKPETGIKSETTASATKSSATQSSLSVKTSSDAVSGKYYVIIGSGFKTRGQAQAHIGRLKGNVVANAGIIESDGKIRVYAQQFSDEKTARSYLDKIRQNPNHKQAWLYKK